MSLSPVTLADIHSPSCENRNHWIVSLVKRSQSTDLGVSHLRIKDPLCRVASMHHELLFEVPYVDSGVCPPCCNYTIRSQ